MLNNLSKNKTSTFSDKKFSFGKIVKLDFWSINKIILILIFGLFIIFPFWSLVTRAFFSNQEDGITLYNFIRFFTKNYYYSSLLRSLLVCGLCMIFSLIIGVPVAYLMTRYNVIGKKFIYILIILTLMSPPFIGAYSWILMFGHAGFVINYFRGLGINLPSIYGPAGIVFVFTLHLYPYIYLYTSGALTSLDASLEEAAENLGSNPLKRIMNVTIPVVLPSILAGAVMVFMTALADFGTPMLLGEGRYVVLPVLVYNEYMSEVKGNANMASALSVVIVATALIILMLQKFVISKRNYIMSSLRPPQVIKLKGFKRFLVSLPVYIIVFIGFLPQIIVIGQSFVEKSFSNVVKGINFNNYIEISHTLLRNIRNTYVFSIIAMLFIVFIGMLVSYIIVRKRSKVSQVIDFLVMFPYVIPGSVLGIALIVAFNKPPLILTGTAIIMIVSYVIRKLPYTVRSGSAFLLANDPSVEEASVSLGVSPTKTFFKITARMMLPGIMSGAIISWITCINELSSSIMLFGGQTSTISVAIYQEVMRMSDGTAAALSTILALSTVISLLIFFKLSKGKVSII